MNKALIGVVVVVVLVGGYLVFANMNNDDQTTNPTPPPPAASPTPTPTPSPTPATEVKSGEVTIIMSSTGFSPAQVTVKKGTKITFVNQDTKPRQPASAPHPTHTDFPEFDAKAGIAAGKSWSFTMDKVGAWGFHDHLFSSQFGKITVVE